jgi:hypothetical protein
MRRRLTALLAMVMLVMMLAASPAAFAQGPGGSENSCGASNPNIGVPAGPPENKGDEFMDCGFRNNPHIGGIPPGQEN